MCMSGTGGGGGGGRGGGASVRACDNNVWTTLPLATFVNTVLLLFIFGHFSSPSSSLRAQL